MTMVRIPGTCARIWWVATVLKLEFLYCQSQHAPISPTCPISVEVDCTELLRWKLLELTFLFSAGSRWLNHHSVAPKACSPTRSSLSSGEVHGRDSVKIQKKEQDSSVSTRITLRGKSLWPVSVPSHHQCRLQDLLVLFISLFEGGGDDNKVTAEKITTEKKYVEYR